MKKTVIKMLSLLLTALMLASCSGNTVDSAPKVADGGSGTAENAIQVQENEPITITIVASLSETTPTDSSNHSVNYIEEHTGYKLKFITLPQNEADAEAKFSLLVSSGDYGDVFCRTILRAQMKQLAREGIVVQIDEYIDSSAELKKLYEMRPEYKDKSYFEDGKIYGFLSVSETYHSQAYPKMWVNQKWMEALNIDVPNTTEEFYDMLVDFRDMDPNGNGIKDEIPLTSNIEWTNQVEAYLMNSFVPFEYTAMSYSKDGKVIFSAAQEEFREGLRYIKRLVDDGLLDVAAFTQKQDQMQQLIRQEPYRVAAYVGEHFGIGVDLANRDQNEAMIAIPPVEGPGGVRTMIKNDFRDRVGNFAYAITDKCQNPQAAFEIGDFMMNLECELTTHHGPEGQGWGKYDAPVKSALGMDAFYWINDDYGSEGGDKFKDLLYIGPTNGTTEVRQMWSPMPDDLYTAEAYETRLTIETQKMLQYFYPEYLPRNIEIYIEDPEEASYFNELRLTLRELIKTNAAQFITGDKSLDSDWDSFVNELKQYQMDKYVELYQQYFEIYKSQASE
ncbi:MAG: extracellular solute-binding protein [Clostridiales bacterium]|nr:extracellular solute-binding protein [Clostridiales bacterium]